MTQEELAQAVGVTKATVSNHERGETEADEGQVQNYAEALGISEPMLRYQSPGQVREASPTYDTTVPRVARGLPLSVREFIHSELLEYTRAGVSEDEIEHARNLFTSPEAFAFFKGGVRGEFNEENVMKDLRAYAKFLRTVFKERGYKPL